MVSKLDFGLFQDEIEVTAPQVRRFENLLFWCAIAGTVATVAPFFGKEVLPAKVRSLALTTGAIGFVGAGLAAMGREKAMQHHGKYLEGQQERLATRNAAEAQLGQLEEEISVTNRALKMIMTGAISAEAAYGLLNKHGLLDYVFTPGTLPGQQPQPQPTNVVDTTAQALPAQQQAATPNYPGEAIAPTYTAAPKKSPLEKIPFEDLARTLANSTADPGCATSVLIAAPRRCGKSNLIRQAIVYANELHKSNIDFNVWNAGKDDEDYCGLQSHDPDYLFTGNAENIPAAVQLLLGGDDVDAIPLIRRCDRWMGQPTLLVGDEWNNTLLAAEMNDKMNRGSKTRDMLIAGSSQYVTRGPGKLALGWFTSHSGQVSSVGWNTDILKNISAIAIARIGRTESGEIVRYGETLKQALGGGNGKESWISDPDDRAKFQKLFTDWFETDDCAVVALTNLLGEWRLVRLPKYPDKHPPIARGPMNQSVAELTGLDKPAPTPNGVYDQLKAKLSATPTESEVKQLWHQITGKGLTSEAAKELINGIKAGVV